jgi:hypothetical protein
MLMDVEFVSLFQIAPRLLGFQEYVWQNAGKYGLEAGAKWGSGANMGHS